MALSMLSRLQAALSPKTSLTDVNETIQSAVSACSESGLLSPKQREDVVLLVGLVSFKHKIALDFNAFPEQNGLKVWLRFSLIRAKVLEGKHDQSEYNRRSLLRICHGCLDECHELTLLAHALATLTQARIFDEELLRKCMFFGHKLSDLVSFRMREWVKAWTIDKSEKNSPKQNSAFPMHLVLSMSPADKLKWQLLKIIIKEDIGDRSNVLGELRREFGKDRGLSAIQAECLLEWTSDDQLLAFLESLSAPFFTTNSSLFIAQETTDHRDCSWRIQAAALYVIPKMVLERRLYVPSRAPLLLHLTQAELPRADPLPLDLIQSGLDHHEDAIRVKALRVAIRSLLFYNNAGQSSADVKDDNQHAEGGGNIWAVIKVFLGDALLGSSAAFRQQCLAALSPLCKRRRWSRQLALLIQHFACFLKPSRTPFARLDMTLRMALLLLPKDQNLLSEEQTTAGHQPLIKPATLIALIRRCKYGPVREYCMQLLCHYQSEMDGKFVQLPSFEELLDDLLSPRASLNEGAALVMTLGNSDQYAQRLSHILLPLITTIHPTDNHHFLEKHVAGVIQAYRMCLEAKKTQIIAEREDFLVSLMDTLWAVIQAAEGVMSHEAPEGLQPLSLNNQGDENDELSGEDDADDEEGLATNSLSTWHPDPRIYTSIAWRAIKESTALLATLSQLKPAAETAQLGRMAALALRLRHPGAFNALLEPITKVALATASFVDIEELVMEGILGQGLPSMPTVDCTRRSAGLPLLLRALLQATLKINQDHAHQLISRVTHDLLVKKVKSDQGTESNNEVLLVHACNCLRGIMRDASLAAGIPSDHWEEALIQALIFGGHPSWSVRNAARLLFGTVMQGIFGPPPKHSASKDINTNCTADAGRITTKSTHPISKVLSSKEASQADPYAWLCMVERWLVTHGAEFLKEKLVDDTHHLLVERLVQSILDRSVQQRDLLLERKARQVMQLIKEETVGGEECINHPLEDTIEWDNPRKAIEALLQASLAEEDIPHKLIQEMIMDDTDASKTLLPRVKQTELAAAYVPHCQEWEWMQRLWKACPRDPQILSAVMDSPITPSQVRLSLLKSYLHDNDEQNFVGEDIRIAAARSLSKYYSKEQKNNKIEEKVDEQIAGVSWAALWDDDEEVRRTVAGEVSVPCAIRRHLYFAESNFTTKDSLLQESKDDKRVLFEREPRNAFKDADWTPLMHSLLG